MAYRRIGLVKGGPQDWGQEAAAKQQGAANVAASNPYSNVAQQQNRALNERISREGRRNISRQNFQQGLQDFYNKHQGGGGLKNFFGGIGDKFGAWAGKMRGGINPETGTWYTQDEYEQNVQNRRDRARMERLRKTRDTKYANDPEGWAASKLSGEWARPGAKGLAGLEKQFGIDQPVNASGFFEQEQIDEAPINNRRDVHDFDDVTFNKGPDEQINYEEFVRNNPEVRTMMPQIIENYKRQNEVLPVNAQFTGNVQDYQQGLLRNVGMNQDQIDAINKKHQQNLAVDQGTTDFFYWNPQEKDVAGFVEDIKGKDTTGWFSDTPTDIVYGDPTTGAQTQEIQDYINSLSNIHGPIKDQKPSGYAGKRLIGIAQGGRVGYKTGGRVGILAAF